jgi:hypothetical protein
MWGKRGKGLGVFVCAATLAALLVAPAVAHGHDAYVASRTAQAREDR